MLVYHSFYHLLLFLLLLHLLLLMRTKLRDHCSFVEVVANVQERVLVLLLAHTSSCRYSLLKQKKKARLDVDDHCCCCCCFGCCCCCFGCWKMTTIVAVFLMTMRWAEHGKKWKIHDDEMRKPIDDGSLNHCYYHYHHCYHQSHHGYHDRTTDQHGHAYHGCLEIPPVCRWICPLK